MIESIFYYQLKLIWKKSNILIKLIFFLISILEMYLAKSLFNYLAIIFLIFNLTIQVSSDEQVTLIKSDLQRNLNTKIVIYFKYYVGSY